jgi:hypothetical protein
MGKLSAVAVKAALANPGTYQDGGGLFLKVDKRGGAYWNLRLQRDGKRQDMGLGSAKLVTLAEARSKSVELRKAVKVEGRDVLTERKDEAAAKVTFREAANQYHSENDAGHPGQARRARKAHAGVGGLLLGHRCPSAKPGRRRLARRERPSSRRLGWRAWLRHAACHPARMGGGGQTANRCPVAGQRVKPATRGRLLWFREREGEALGVPAQGSRQRSAQTTAPLWAARSRRTSCARARGPAGVRQ